MTKPSLAARLLEAFLQDLEEQLGTLNRALLSLELDATNADALKSVFRVMHTLKGAAQATHQPLVERACHRLETILAVARDGGKALGPEEFALMFSAADALSDTARTLGAGGVIDDATPIGRLVATLEKTSEQPSVPETPRTPVARRGDPAVPAPPPATTAPAAQNANAPGDAAVRVSAEKLDALLSQVGQLLATRALIAEH